LGVETLAGAKVLDGTKLTSGGSGCAVLKGPVYSPPALQHAGLGCG